MLWAKKLFACQRLGFQMVKYWWTVLNCFSLFPFPHLQIQIMSKCARATKHWNYYFMIIHPRVCRQKWAYPKEKCLNIINYTHKPFPYSWFFGVEFVYCSSHQVDSISPTDKLNFVWPLWIAINIKPLKTVMTISNDFNHSSFKFIGFLVFNVDESVELKNRNSKSSSIKKMISKYDWFHRNYKSFIWIRSFIHLNRFNFLEHF